MEKKTTSIKINPELWQEVKIHCIREKIDISDYLERLIRDNLSKISNKEKKTTAYVKML